MDVLFLVVDSLRGHAFADGRVAETPFLDSLHGGALRFDRAYASECWTLPSHASIFTGKLPAEHGAHFHSMAYRDAAPTLAEILAGRGYATEMFTRNSVLDGSIPGICRGFAERTAVLREAKGLDATALFLACAKPRVRRHLRGTGFFHPRQRGSREFARRFAQALQPADELLLDRVLTRMRGLRREGRRFFVFANLYDVHAPYPPSTDSLLLPWRTASGARENLAAPWVLSRLGQHRYLRRGFCLADSTRNMLERRYRRAVSLMDAKLARFFAALDGQGLLEDVLVILTSDHGEGFGEHGLFLHDASLYESHIRVPLWLLTPRRAAGRIADVVTTRHLFGLVERATRGGGDAIEGGATLLDADFRRRHGLATAQHFHYPRVRDADPVYRSNQFAAVGERYKLMVRGGAALLFDLRQDPHELRPRQVAWREGVAAVVASLPPHRRPDAGAALQRHRDAVL